MTLVTHTTFFRNDDYTQDGRQAGGVYTNTEGAFDFNVGEWLYSRMQLTIPKGATIVSAVLKFQYGMKDRAQAGSASMNVGFEGVDNSPRHPEVSGTAQSNRLYNGVAYTAAITINHAANSPDANDVVAYYVTTQLQTLIDREGWEAGNYTTIIFEPTAKSGTQLSLGMRDNAFLTQHVQLDVTYQYEDMSPDVVDVNMHPAQSPESSIGAFDKNISFEVNQNFFGTRATGTTLDFTAPPVASPVGTNAIRVLANPAAGEETRRFGPHSYQEGRHGEWVMFSGWFYNPSANIGNFTGEFVYLGAGGNYAERDQWHPFETTPFQLVDDDGNDRLALWLECDLLHCKRTDGGNAYFWIDGLTLTRSDKRPAKLFPFTAWSVSNKFREHEHKNVSTWDRDGSVRRRARDVYVLDSATGLAKPKDRWVRSITKPVSVALVPGSTRKASMCAGIKPVVFGTGATLTENVTYQGRTWTRLATTGASGTARLNVPLSRLTSSVNYTASWLVANSSASTVSITVDWCDLGSTTASLAPGETRIMTASGARAYDSTFRFTDLALTTLNANVLFAPYEARVVRT